MALRRVSAHVWSLGIWLGIHVHVWLVEGPDGLTLVDAGIPTMAAGILRAVERIGGRPLSRVALTHGHPDHVGSLKRILARHPVPVVAHRAEIPYIEGERAYRAGGKPFNTLEAGGTTALEEDGSGNLRPVGGLVPYHTPGHAPGHVVYHHPEDGVLLAGDLFSSRGGRMRRPLFTPDMAETLQSSRIVGTLRPRRMEVCHGLPVMSPADQLDAYLAREGRRIASRGTTASGAARH